MSKLFAVLSIVAVAALGLPATNACAHGEGSGAKHSHHAQAKAPKSFASKPQPGTKATCPVMGHAFTVKASTETSTYKDRHYAFCCAGCKPKFDKDPRRYTGR